MTFWSSYATVYDLIWDSPATDRIRTAIERESAGAATVVDLGCGTGLMSAGLHAAGSEVIGVDTSARMLALAARKSRISRGVAAPAERTGLPSAIADVVIVAALLHLHPRPADVLAEARRLLRPGGVVVVTWPRAGLSPERMFAIDRDEGRGWFDATRADRLRRAVNLLALFSGGTVAARAAGTERDVDRVLADAVGWERSDPGFVGGAQHVAVLRALAVGTQLSESEPFIDEGSTNPRDSES